MRPARRHLGHVPVHPEHSTAGSGGLVSLAIVVAAVAALAAVIATASAFWLCVPGVIVVAGGARGRREAAAGTLLVAAAAAVPLVCRGVHPLPSPAVAGFVLAATAAIVTGMRERANHERDTLRGVALSDPLTGLANRRVLISRADYEISRHIRERRTFAVVMLDLDGFKLLNDRFGHAAGDELLCDVAAALTGAVRAQDTVARLGGDEFCVLAPETDADGTLQLLDRVAGAVGDATAGVESLSASLGVALFPEDARTAAGLIDVADQRLLEAKRRRYRRGTARRRAA